MGSQNCLFRVRHILFDTCLSKSEQQLPSSSSTLFGSDSSGAWICSDFRIQVRSADECVSPGRRQPRETRWISHGRLSFPETNLKVGLLPLFFIQYVFLSFMVRTSLTEISRITLTQYVHGFSTSDRWRRKWAQITTIPHAKYPHFNLFRAPFQQPPVRESSFQPAGIDYMQWLLMSQKQCSVKHYMMKNCLNWSNSKFSLR